ncbi:hypothetical protein BJX64DRAFT_28215 [Aspergillus heterothallicus]
MHFVWGAPLSVLLDEACAAREARCKPLRFATRELQMSDHQIHCESRVHVPGSIWCDLTLGQAAVGARTLTSVCSRLWLESPHLMLCILTQPYNLYILASPRRPQPPHLRSYHALSYITGLHLAAITIGCMGAGFVLGRCASSLVAHTTRDWTIDCLPHAVLSPGRFGIYSFMMHLGFNNIGCSNTV